MKQKNIYRLDNSAMLHIAAKQKNHTNTFRIEMVLSEAVDEKILQRALENIIKRFPTVIAEIHKGILQYYLCPVQKIPKVMKETHRLPPMSNEEIRNGAFRILYNENSIMAEFFHSLTDGHGGLVVTSTLVAEYLRLRYGVEIPCSELILDRNEEVRSEETVDDYITFAGKNIRVPQHKISYQMSDYARTDGKICSDIQYYKADEVLKTAHMYHVSVTTFIASVMLKAILDIQKKNSDEKRKKQPVQVLIPVDLRKIYGSTTLRNFSLFALCGIEPQKKTIPLNKITSDVDRQIKMQATKQHMSETMASQVKAAHFALYSVMMSPIKRGLLRLAHELWGESNSCITVSNLGVISFPKNMEKYVENVSIELTPRRKSPYNCGIVSYKGKMIVRFSRYCKETDLEDIFLKYMQNNIS